MNTRNALGFFVLGTLMNFAPELAAALPPGVADAWVVTTDSVSGLWLALMSWVVGGIGAGYLLREGAVRLPGLVATALPERLLRPVEAKPEAGAEQMPVGVRVQF